MLWHAGIAKQMGTMQERVSRLITEMFADIKANAVREGKVNTGKTIASLEQRYTPEAGRHVFEVWANKYFGALDTGSAPARRKGTDAERAAFLRELAAWCSAKGFPSAGLTPEQYERAAKWLKWYIQKNGSYLFRHPAEQYRVIRPAVARFEERLEQKLTALYEAEIENIFTKRK